MREPKKGIMDKIADSSNKPVAWYWLIVLLIAFFGGLFLGYIVFGANIFNCTID